MKFGPAALLTRLKPARDAAPAALKAPMRTQVHAVKRVAWHPEGEDDTREGYAVELTVTALDLRTAWSWLPTALYVKAPDQPADEAPWGTVVDARVWRDEGWEPATEKPLVGTHRIRVLLAVWPGAPAELAWRFGQVAIGALDLGRADLAGAAEADDGFRTPGECAQCQDMTMLNGDGLCARCRPLPPCGEHPETPSAARCVACGKHFCEACLAGPKCQACAAKGGKKNGARGRAAAAPAAAAPGGLGLKLPADRKKLLGPLVGVFLAVNLAVFAWQYYDGLGPPASPEQHYAQRYGIVRGAIDAYKAEKKALPPDAAALAKFLAGLGGEQPTISGATTPLPKDAVIYVKKGDGFELYPTTAEGKKYVPEDAAKALDKPD